MKYIDPIKLLIEKASTKQSHPALEIAKNEISDLPYEIPMSPAPGTKVINLTIASTYRTPIPVIFDPQTRTTYPLPNDK